MPSMGSQTDLESQLFEMITKQNKLESLIIKNAPKVPVPDSVAVLAFKRVGPILGPVWTLLSPLIKEQMGIQDKSIGEVLKAIDEVKDLQNQTLSVLQDLQSEVQSLDAIKAQDRLKRYLKDLHNLTTYDPKATKSIEKEKTRIRTAVINTARDDLEAIDRALMGDTEPGITGVRRNGLLKHFYTRMYEKFEKDGGWSIPAFAQALDTYLFAAHQLQLHYFFLWTVSTYDLDDQEGLKNRSNNLFARLSEQEKQLSTMRPLAVGYFSRDPDAVSPHRRYRLNRIAERDKFLHAVMWDNPAGGGGEFCWSDLNHTQIANHTSSISFSYSSTPDLKLSEWDRDSFPIRTTVEEESMTGMGIVETELKESKVYYGTGYVALSTWAEEWWATNSWVMSWAPGADRLLLTPDKGERARVQIIPIHEGNLGRPNEICVQLRSYQDNKRHWLFSKETNFVLQVMDGDAPAKYKSPPKSVWEAPINVGKNLWKEIFG